MLNKIIFSLALSATISNFVFSQEIAATINGHKISTAELERSYQQHLLFPSPKKITKETVLEELINRRISIQNAQRNKLDQDPIVKEKLEDILYHAQISKDLEPQLLKITVSDAEVEKYYRDNKEYRTSQILFRVRAVATVDEVKQALAKANETYAELTKNPDNFADLANKLSQSSAAQIGGDVGYQPPTRLAPEYFDAIKGKQVGHITKPVRTQFGYHIVKVTGIKDFDKINKDLYKKIIYDIKRDAILNAYFKGLRKNAKVNINKNTL